MIRIIRLTGLLFLLMNVQQSFGQTKNQKDAELLLKRAMNLEDQGKLDDALSAINRAQKIDPANPQLPYEQAYVYHLKKDHNQVIDLLEKAIIRKDAFGKMYQLLGNTYDELGQPDKSIDAYQRGLKAFPKTGELYLELGNVQLKKKDYFNALSWYEKGIEMDPIFPSNYYRAAKIYLRSAEKVWGMLYGELFVLLEFQSERVTEISKSLFDTYKSAIVIQDTVLTLRMSSNLFAEKRSPTDSTRLSFAKLAYDPGLLKALKDEKTIDINSLIRIRKRFIENYYTSNNWQRFPNALFDYEYTILKAGYFEAYSRWVLSAGNPDDFKKWKEDNRDAYEKFMKWIFSHPIKLDDKYKFYRLQY